MPSYSQRKKRIAEFKNICGSVNDSTAQKVLEANVMLIYYNNVLFYLKPNTRFI